MLSGYQQYLVIKIQDKKEGEGQIDKHANAEATSGTRLSSPGMTLYEAHKP